MTPNVVLMSTKSSNKSWSVCGSCSNDINAIKKSLTIITLSRFYINSNPDHYNDTYLKHWYDKWRRYVRSALASPIMTSNIGVQLQLPALPHGDLQFTCSGHPIVIEHDVLVKRSWVFQAMWTQRPAYDQHQPLQVVIHHNLEDVIRYINYVYDISM